jgi:hypothetical protein
LFGFVLTQGLPKSFLIFLHNATHQEIDHDSSKYNALWHAGCSDQDSAKERASLAAWHENELSPQDR